MMMMMNARQRSSLFTASQWQELELQALIFKYMISGIPIPSNLLYTMRRSGVLQDPAIAQLIPPIPRLFPPHPIGWGCFQMGSGRNPDPEPGRCRRTDGKKWRCSKEAYPDSKYCEKHMHRGRNRSRKPVEVMTATTAASVAKAPSDPSFPNPTLNPAKSAPDIPGNLLHHHHPYSLNPFHLSSRTSEISPPHFALGTGSFSADHRDYRYLHGLKEEVDEHPFFSEASGSLRSISSASPFDCPWRSKSGLLGQPKQHANFPAFPVSNYSHSQLQMEESNEADAGGQSCFSLGTDVNLDLAGNPAKREDERQPLRQFFEEWPLKSCRSDSWLDLEEDLSNQKSSFSATQLSISIPMSASDLQADNPAS